MNINLAVLTIESTVILIETMGDLMLIRVICEYLGLELSIFQ